jgi:hypothetical protein
VPKQVVGIYLKRWQIVAAFVVVVGAFIVQGALLKSSINQINHDKASVQSLEHSNCKTKVFLASSAAFRKRLAKRDTDPVKKKTDLQSAKVSLRLARNFSNEDCPK